MVKVLKSKYVQDANGLAVLIIFRFEDGFIDFVNNPYEQTSIDPLDKCISYIQRLFLVHCEVHLLLPGYYCSGS